MTSSSAGWHLGRRWQAATIVVLVAAFGACGGTDGGSVKTSLASASASTATSHPSESTSPPPTAAPTTTEPPTTTEAPTTTTTAAPTTTARPTTTAAVPPATMAPPPPAPTATAASSGGCHPSYQGTCIPPDVSDADCAGGSGNGPYYVQEKNIRVVGPDVFDLDRNGDGIGCEG